LKDCAWRKRRLNTERPAQESGEINKIRKVNFLTDSQQTTVRGRGVSLKRRG